MEENGLAIVTSLLSASKSKPVLLAALRTLITLAETPSDECAADCGADGATLISRCGAVPAAVRLACPTAYGGDASAAAAVDAKSGVGSGAESGDGDRANCGRVDAVPLAALALLLKLASRPELRPALRSLPYLLSLKARTLCSTVLSKPTQAGEEDV